MAMQLIGVMNPKTAVQMMSRVGLREFLLSKGKNIRPGETADRMRQIIMGEGLDISPFVQKTVHGNWMENKSAIGQLRSKRLRRHEPKEEPKEETIGTPPTVTITEEVKAEPEINPLNDVEKLKMPQLRKLAKQLGLKQSNKDKAPDLIRKIQDYGKDTS